MDTSQSSTHDHDKSDSNTQNDPQGHAKQESEEAYTHAGTEYSGRDSTEKQDPSTQSRRDITKRKHESEQTEDYEGPRESKRSKSNYDTSTGGASPHMQHESIRGSIDMSQPFSPWTQNMQDAQGHEMSQGYQYNIDETKTAPEDTPKLGQASSCNTATPTTSRTTTPTADSSHRPHNSRMTQMLAPTDIPPSPHRPPSSINSRPGSQQGSRPSSRSNTPRSTNSTLPFSATYRSPFDNPFQFPAFSQTMPVGQQGFLPMFNQGQLGNLLQMQQQNGQILPWSNYMQPSLQAPLSKLPFPNFVGRPQGPLFDISTIGLPPPAPLPLLPHPSRFPTPADILRINSQPLKSTIPFIPPQEGSEPIPSPSGMTNLLPPGHPRRSSIPEGERGPSQVIDNATNKLLRLFSKGSELRVQAECRRLIAERNAWEEDSRRKAQEIARLQQRVAQLEQQNSAATQRTQAGGEGGDGVAKAMQIMQQEITTLQTRVVQQTTQISRLKAAGIEKLALEAANRTLRASNEELSTRVQEYQKHRADAAAKLAMFKARAEVAVAQVAEKGARIAELERAMEAAKEQGDAARKEAEVSEARLVEVRGDVVDAHARISSLEKAAAERVRYIETLEDTCAEVTDALLGLDLEQDIPI